MDSWRRQILADIGISTWVGRDQLPSLALLNPDVPDLEVASPQAQARPAAAAVPERVADQARTNARTHAGTTLAALADSLDGGSKRVPAPRGHSPEPSLPDLGQAAAEPVRYPEVACLWSGNAVLFCVPGELQGQVRLAKDILASAANSWSAPTEQVVFRWSELQASGFASADADRALLAFAEKRIEVTTARWAPSPLCGKVADFSPKDEDHEPQHRSPFNRQQCRPWPCNRCRSRLFIRSLGAAAWGC